MEEKEIKEYIECDCGAENLQLSYNGEDDLLDIAFYTYSGKDNKTPFLQKIKYILAILKYGTPYGDQVILNKENRLKLRNILHKIDKD